MRGIDQVAPPPKGISAIGQLQPRDAVGWGYLGLAGAISVVAAGLSISGGTYGWVVGQVLFAVAFVQWFVLLHEAGHHTLFRTRWLNRFAGWMAGFFALIPYPSWQRIHARHHRWTGWQDLDATTASLVPRALAPWERRAIDFAWRTNLPLFSLIYRFSNYWQISRVAAYLRPIELAPVKLGVVLSLSAYAALVLLVDPILLIQCCGVGRLLAFAIEDPLLLSQHTHIPQQLAGRPDVQPFTPLEQQAFTRSLKLPRFFSWLILHFDAHELHHMYVRVPGYDLPRIGWEAPNTVDWWVWLRGAKKLPGSVFIFQNRTHTGFDL